MAQLRSWSADSDLRLITLTGPPGVGKTRLAQEIFAELRGDYDGAFGVAMAGLHDEGLVGPAICRELGIREQARQRPAETIVRSCQDRRLLVMLDNFEHLVGAAPLLAELLGRCRRLRLLVTSRASLRIRGGYELPIEPLPLPDVELAASGSVEGLIRVPSVTLFRERARAVVPAFEVTAANASEVATICRRLDGLPLALELAAPWVKLLTPAGLLDQLGRQMGLQMEGSRDLPERQRTMAATLAWSCDLLRDDERALLRRLSVFAGSAPLDAIESVCQAAAPLPASTMRLLGVLADQHLVRREPAIEGQQRVSMLETIREYGRMLLDEAGEADATDRAHAEHYDAVVAAARSLLTGPEQVSCARRLEGELDNVRAVLAWSAERGDVETGLRMAAGLVGFWETSGRLREGLTWLERLLLLTGAGEAGEAGDPRVRGAAQEAAGLLAARLGDFDLSRRRHEESLALCRELDDRGGVAAALHGLGLLDLWRGEPREAEPLLEQALEIRRETGDRYALAVTQNVLGAVVSELGDGEQPRAMRYYEESLAIYRQLGTRIGVSRCLINLGVSARRMGELDRSAASLEEAVELARELDAPELLASALVNLGNVRRSRGDAAAARDLYAEGLRTFSRIGDHRWIAYTLECLAWLAWGVGELRRAARIYGSAGDIRQQFAMPGWPVTSSEHAEALNALRRELGADLFGTEYGAGRRLSPLEAMAEAVECDV